jgi:hypothetical protein
MVRSMGNRKTCIKIACTTDVIVCRVCEGGDLELPIDGVGAPAARIGTWKTVRQDGALATVQWVCIWVWDGCVNLTVLSTV